MRLKLSVIKAKAPNRPPGYYEDVISHGTVVGEHLEIDSQKYAMLLKKYQGPANVIIRNGCCGKPSQFPPVTQEVRNAAGAVVRTVGAILRREQIKVSEEVASERLSICEACEHYLQGRCKLCGCFTKLKLLLATEQCPDKPPRWNKIIV